MSERPYWDHPEWDYTLVLPDTWHVWEPDPARREESIAHTVEAWVADDPQLAPAREDLRRRIRLMDAEADARGSFVSAFFHQLMDGKPVVAFVEVFEGIRNLPDDLDAELAHIAEQRAVEQPSHLGQPDVSIVQLPGGRAVRARVLGETERDEDGSSIVCDLVEYWLPVPGTTGIVILNCQTPSLAYADELVEAFDHIAGTLRIVWADAPIAEQKP